HRPLAGQGFGSGLQGFGIKIPKADTGSGSEQALGDGQADAASAARDHCVSSVQIDLVHEACPSYPVNTFLSRNGFLPGGIKSLVAQASCLRVRGASLLPVFVRQAPAERCSLNPQVGKLALGVRQESSN